MPPRSLVEAIAWHHEAWQLKEAIRIERRSLEWSNRATAAWLSVAREIGRLLSTMTKQSGARTPEFLRGTPQLRDLGLRKKQSHEYQLLARIPDDTFFEFIWYRINGGVELTKAEALAVARGFVDGDGPGWRGRRLGIGAFVRVPAEVLSDIVDAAHGAADDIEAGTNPANAMAAALDAIMERVGAFVGCRRAWEGRRRIIERSIDVAAARTANDPPTAMVGTT